ncbi:MAG: hypothetical protein MZV63_49230 [Marinilabiliales bacterium]|nr:hypothetical protein [Marinilabiliales bacterium]
MLKASAPAENESSKLTAELFLQLVCQVYGERVQSTAAHVHHRDITAKNIFVIDRLKGVGQLQPELKLRSSWQRWSAVTLLSLTASAIFQVVGKGLVRHHGFESKLVVKDFPQLFRSEEGRVQFDQGMQLSLLTSGIGQCLLSHPAGTRASWRG